jgi:sialate O-acetylesterase
MNILKKIIIFSLMLFSLSKGIAQLSIAKVIANNMVLQRNQPVPIWGSSKAGDAVTVNFNKQEKKTITGSDGNWKIILDAMTASATPQQMIIKTEASTIVLDNILIGEVWLCSGQSNMEYTMRKNSKVTMPDSIKNWPVNELQTAHNKSIRIFLVDRKKMKPDPAHSGWDVAEDSALRSFSAVGYFFAKKLYEELHVPIGMIESAIPGSRIEPWMPGEAFTALPFFNDHTDSTHKIDGEPGKFYETMIAPLAPFALKGFLWYQGESNCFLGERLQYTYKMKALIDQWRKLWSNNAMPFYYVQIAPYAYSKQKGNVAYTEESEPEFWEAQQLALKIPHTAMIATTDLNYDLDNLHPHFKWDIGKRLALAALYNEYGKKDSAPMGPLYKNSKVQGNKMLISFTYAGKGLVSNDNNALNNFTIAGEDGKFVPATATIKKDKVEVYAAAVPNPVAVRFGWNEADHSNLYNKDGLPALSFRTDNPLEEKFKQ